MNSEKSKESTTKSIGRCRVCGSQFPGDDGLCQECRGCEIEAEKRRKFAVRKRTFGIGAANGW